MTSKIKAAVTIIKILQKFIAKKCDLSLIRARKCDNSQFEILDLRGS